MKRDAGITKIILQHSCTDCNKCGGYALCIDNLGYITADVDDTESRVFCFKDKITDYQLDIIREKMFKMGLNHFNQNVSDLNTVYNGPSYTLNVWFGREKLVFSNLLGQVSEELIELIDLIEDTCKVDCSVFEAARKPRKCPKCGKSPVATILYGFPVFTDKLMSELATGRKVLGGCNIPVDAPQWSCSFCGTKIYREESSFDNSFG
ncbi:hypothetical protein [Bacteroides sedimenti]|uniref:Uncharacterized protein n=1 Tax=Bacteroides sedimenti TaxID=2136147 RepID=A0ABN6Z275_9BACE